MGVGALGAGIAACASKAYPSIDVCVLDYGKESIKKTYIIDGRAVDVKLLNIRYSKRIFLRNNIAILLAIATTIRLVPSKVLREFTYRNTKYLRRIHEADIIGAISGGDSFSDIYGLARFYYVVLPQLLILLMGKKLVLLPQTLGPFHGRVSRSVARWIIKKASLVYSRDSEGVEEARALLGENNDQQKIRFTYDVGFAVDPVQPACINIIGLGDTIDKQRIVGLNISGLLYMGGYTKDNMFGLKIDYQAFVKALISNLIEKNSVPVLLIPHVFGTDGNSESDETACRTVYDELCKKYPGQLGYLQGEYDQNGIKYIIGMCDFFIGSRMHACIAAVSQNIPTVSIAYSKKFRGVMDTVGMGAYVADPRMMGEMKIFNLIVDAYKDRAEIREKLALKMPQVKASVLGLFREIWSELGRD
jgi:colanic acid/amylovoran biosynthesis protein